MGEARLGRERRLALVPAHDPEEAPHLGERLPSRLLDGEQRLARPRRFLVEEKTGRPRLHGHDADRVSYHVVEIACDADALRGDRRARPFFAFALEQQQTSRSRRPAE
jgi:hypothetical protein